MNESTYLKKLEKIDPILVRIRKMLGFCPPDIVDSIFEVWENIMLGRQWAASRKSSEVKQQMAGIIKIRVTKDSINIDKNFEVTHPRSIYRKK